MNINLRSNGRGIPSDTEIEREVAELRQMLEGIEGPSEPHPAYYQNFLVRVRSRVDEQQGFRRKRWSLTATLASIGSAAVVAAVVFSGVLSPTSDQTVAVNDPNAGATEQVDKNSGSTGSQEGESDKLFADVDASTPSIVLSSGDVKMLDAIMSDNDAEIFNALVENEDL